jgi:hypothetical protein
MYHKLIKGRLVERAKYVYEPTHLLGWNFESASLMYVGQWENNRLTGTVYIDMFESSCRRALQAEEEKNKVPNYRYIRV